MTKETQTVWRTKKGRDLVIMKASGEIQIPVFGVTIEEADELRDALTEILNASALAEVVVESRKASPVQYAPKEAA